MCLVIVMLFGFVDWPTSSFFYSANDIDGIEVFLIRLFCWGDFSLQSAHVNTQAK